MALVLIQNNNFLYSFVKTCEKYEFHLKKKSHIAGQVY